MRFLALCGLPLLVSCGGPGLVFNNSQQMSPDAMLQRADLVFVGVIQKHSFETYPFFTLRIPGDDPKYAHHWRVLRRTVQVETILRGHESREVISVYEYFWTGGASGHWNATQNGERNLFLVRRENGRYHIVRDWWHSIFPVTTGRKPGLPLDESRPF